MLLAQWQVLPVRLIRAPTARLIRALTVRLIRALTVRLIRSLTARLIRALTIQLIRALTVRLIRALTLRLIRVVQLWKPIVLVKNGFSSIPDVSDGFEGFPQSFAEVSRQLKNASNIK